MKIGFIGLGIMGESMCENVIKKSGCEVYVFDIVSAQVQKMVALGAKAAADSKEVAKICDIIISMVPGSEHVKAVVKEILPVLGSGKIVIDMSTIDPEVSVGLSREVANTGAIMLDAPVVKSKPAAIEGKLGIYVGGDEKVYMQVRPILLYMGCNVIRLGENGKGLVMKIIHNMLVAQIQNGVNEMMVLADKANLDFDQVVTAISYGGGQNFYLDNKHRAIKNLDFTTAFSVENMHKDVNIAGAFVEKLGIKLPGVDMVVDIYKEAMEENIGREDFSATYKIIKKRAE